MIHLVVHVASHVGHVRETNQDRVVVGRWLLAPDLPGEAVLNGVQAGCAVALLDGMGGHAAGDIAATTAAEVLASSAGVIDGREAVVEAVQRANAAVYARMAAIPQLAGMGASLVGLALVGEQVVLFNVGDARGYVETNGYLNRLSTDDVAPSGALTRALGGRATFEPVEPHLVTEPAPGRRFLLATDGLFGHIDLAGIESCLVDDDRETVRALMTSALGGGGPDNVSVALVRPVVPTDEADDR